MGYLNDVCAHIADQGGDLGQQARTVIADNTQTDQALGPDQFAGQNRGE